MAELPSYGKLGLQLPFKCNEGNMTIQTGSVVGGDVQVPVFANPIANGDWVTLSGDNTITKATKDSTELLGQVVGTPQWKGRQPTASKTWGNYEPRRVTVDTFGQAVRTVQLEAANTAVAAAESVKIGATTAQRFDKASALNTTRALVGAGASSGAKIPVLFGFIGDL